MESAQDYELFHYGVKGMKWGVRRSDRGRRLDESRRKLSNLEDKMLEAEVNFRSDLKNRKLKKTDRAAYEKKRDASERKLVDAENSFVKASNEHKALKKDVRKERASDAKDLAIKNLKASAWTNQVEGKARAQKLLERHNGSKVKAIGHSLAANGGRAAATAFLTAPLALTPAGILAIPASTGVAVGTTGRHMQDVYNIVRNK